MSFLNFTPREIRALLFLLMALLVGSGITLYKRNHPQFAPELVMEKNDLAAFSGMHPTVPAKEEGTENKPNVPPKPIKINVNQAQISELERVPGLGPKLSQRIIEYRKVNGPFHKLEDLIKVRGIGPKNLEQIKDYLTVE